MLQEQLGAQRLVCFTGDGEDESRGADQVVETLRGIGIFERLEMVIVLDLTEESFGSPSTAAGL